MYRYLKKILNRLIREQSLERIKPNSWNPIEIYLMKDHLDRYKFAEQFTTQKLTLDIACGFGYGTRLLANSAQKVIGVDLSKDSIKQASRRYLLNNLQFVCSDALDFLRINTSFEVICSFETVEHISDYKMFLKLLFARLKHKGTLIISSPNRDFGELFFGDSVSPYHIKEFYTNELFDMLKDIFKNKPQVYRQRMFSRKNMVLSALFSLINLNPKIEKDKNGDSSVTNIFVVQKE